MFLGWCYYQAQSQPALDWADLNICSTNPVTHLTIHQSQKSMRILYFSIHLETNLIYWRLQNKLLFLPINPIQPWLAIYTFDSINVTFELWVLQLTNETSKGCSKHISSPFCLEEIDFLMSFIKLALVGPSLISTLVELVLICRI